MDACTNVLIKKKTQPTPPPPRSVTGLESGSLVGANVASARNECRTSVRRRGGRGRDHVKMMNTVEVGADEITGEDPVIPSLACGDTPWLQHQRAETHRDGATVEYCGPAPSGRLRSERQGVLRWSQHPSPEWNAASPLIITSLVPRCSGQLEVRLPAIPGNKCDKWTSPIKMPDIR